MRVIYARYDIIFTMFKPVYTITPLILSRIAEIAEIKAAVERSRVLPLNEAQLRREAILKMAHTSTSIEGNKLAQFEVGKVQEGKAVRAPQKDIQEVENYLNALKLLDELAKVASELTLEEVLKMHKTVTNGLVEDEKSGKFRPADVYVIDDLGGGKERLRFKAPPATDVSLLVNNLLDWIKLSQESGIHPVLIAGIFHLEFVSIHPFTDGNGRVARLLTQLLLYRMKWDFRKIIVLEDYYNRDRAAYYAAEHHGEGTEYQPERDFTHWLEYFSTGFLVEARKSLEQIQSIGYGQASKNSEQVYLDRDEMQIMDFLVSMGGITSEDVVDILKVSKRTAQLKLKKLLESGLIKRQGQTTATQYTLNK